MATAAEATRSTKIFLTDDGEWSLVYKSKGQGQPEALHIQNITSVATAAGRLTYWLNAPGAAAPVAAVGHIMNSSFLGAAAGVVGPTERVFYTDRDIYIKRTDAGQNVSIAYELVLEGEVN